MSPIDPSTFGTGEPRTFDGRTYPSHLRVYEAYDDVLLPVVADRQPATFDQLSIAIPDARMRASLPRWLASAEWRGLVKRLDSSMDAPRTYGLGPQADDHLPHAA
ncbi:MAG TPA: hypothetical protein VFG42_17040 [Baekduia sp.]|uniref:hypothetical protein n=1 Tax=Baekduia sp. TaxID=2600305 RepID=UPI002D79E87D|nr:hypothetical protein [Baekduia sp.]HET6508501.1 hypothetical protein [Baekduia sp.]